MDDLDHQNDQPNDHQNINHDEQALAHFSEQAQAWWDRDGAMKTLHDINPARLEFIGRQTLLTDKKVLDIGCGGGILSEAMAEMGAKVVGIDLSPELIATAQQHANERQLSLDYQCIAVETLAEKEPASFDVITCMEMLEHVPDPSAIIAAAAVLLKPQGWLLVSTLNNTLKAKVLGVWVAEYVLQLLPQGTHDPEQFIDPATLARWARQNQLTAHSLTGLHYNPLTRQARLSMPADINYLMAFQK